jgi:hypothetical protein
MRPAPAQTNTDTDKRSRHGQRQQQRVWLRTDGGSGCVPAAAVAVRRNQR